MERNEFKSPGGCVGGNLCCFWALIGAPDLRFKMGLGMNVGHCNVFLTAKKHAREQMAEIGVFWVVSKL